jgi:TolB-like protein
MAKEALDPPGAVAPAPPVAEIRAALERILRSRGFRNAGRASDFLRFAVDKTLAGELDRLKGYAIAMHVFGRSRDFDAQSDPLVRVEASRLRQRLAEYYAGEGAEDRVRIEVPRGGYAVKASYALAEAARPVTAPAPAKRGPIALLRAHARASHMAVVLLLIAVASIAVQQHSPVAEQAPSASSDGAHRTTIAVVPFENLAGTAEFERLAAGLTEEVMLRLDELDLFVIDTHARTDGPPRGVPGSGHQYVLMGSVRAHSGGARIGARIVQAETGAVIWSAAYDEPPGIARQPALQAKVARDAAAAAAAFGPVFYAELAVARREAHTLELPDCQNRYRAFRRATDPALFPDAAACFESLVERRPLLAHAWAGVAMVAIDEHLFYSGNGSSPLERGWEATRKALELENDNVLANVALVRAQYYQGDPAFVSTAERVLALDPANVDVMAVVGILLAAYGDDVHGLELVDRALALSPLPRPTFNVAHAFSRLRAQEPCEAQAAAQSMEAPKWFITYVMLSAAAALCGDEAAATAARRRLLELSPNFDAEARALVGYWRFDPVLEETLLRGLRQAGFDLR